MNRIARWVLALLVLISVLGFSVNAQADTTSKKFKPYDVTQTWYKDGGTLVNPWPQSTTAIECGGITQIDTYTIDTAQLEYQYNALVAGGTLSGPVDDAKFHPHNYKVSLLPECQPVVPPKPDDVVTHETVSGCAGEGQEIEGVQTRDVTVTYVLDTETNTWVAQDAVYSEWTWVRALTPEEQASLHCVEDSAPPTSSPAPSPTCDGNSDIVISPNGVVTGPDCSSVPCPGDLIRQGDDCVVYTPPATTPPPATSSAAPKPTTSLAPAVKITKKAMPTPSKVVPVVLAAKDTSALANTGASFAKPLVWGILLMIIGFTIMFSSNIRRIWRRRNH